MYFCMTKTDISIVYILYRWNPKFQNFAEHSLLKRFDNCMNFLNLSSVKQPAANQIVAKLESHGCTRLCYRSQQFVKTIAAPKSISSEFILNQFGFQWEPPWFLLLFLSSLKICFQTKNQSSANGLKLFTLKMPGLLGISSSFVLLFYSISMCALIL